MKKLAQFRNHPAVQEIILESDHGRRTYVINLRPGFATDNGGGQQSGTESTLAGVAAFLKTVAAMPVEDENLKAAIDHVRMEQTCFGPGENLRAVVESFNSLTPSMRACLSEAAWIVKKERLNGGK
jgi:hypothetical protein